MKSLFVDYGINGTYCYLEDENCNTIGKSDIISGSLIEVAYKIRAAAKKNGIKKIKVDSSGLGEGLFDLLSNELLNTDVSVYRYKIKKF